MKINVQLRRIILIFAALILLSACAKEADSKIMPEIDSSEANPATTLNVDDNSFITRLSDISVRITGEQERKRALEESNPYRHVSPDESGKVMIIMFHSFIEEYEEGDDKTVTTTLSAFRALLEQLYEDGYRTTSLSDFINGSISVQRGTKPIIFTFDDGRRSQFSFVENEDGTISESSLTAVAVMEQFYEEHPDFGLNGTFFLNLGFSGTFGTVGSLKQRLEAIAAKGFELENHSYSHANLSLFTTGEQIMEEIGKNSKTLNELLPGRTMTVLALPYGNSNKELSEYVEAGTYDGLPYKNSAIMLVGAEPAAQMYLKDSDPIKIRRILASGIEPVDCDFEWWYKLGGKHEFVSDGNPNKITVPADKLELLDEQKIKALGKEIVVITEGGEG